MASWRPILEIGYLEEFIYLADTLSFKQTAARYFVSRSVISRHVAALEETLGARLLDRDSRATQLTKAGEAFYSEAKIIVREWNLALDRVRQIADGVTSLVRIGYLRNAARPLLSRFVRELNARYPEIRLSLVCMSHRELVDALASHDVDIALAVRVSPEQSRNYRSMPLYQDHYTVVCAPDHPLAREAGAISVDELAQEPLLIPESFAYGKTAAFVDDLADEESLAIARVFYDDIDVLTLKVETEGILAFSSTLNNLAFKDRFAIMEIGDADTTFQVNAFFHDDFEGAEYEACRDVLEWCAQGMPQWYPSLGAAT